MADPARARKLAVRIRQIVSAAIETQIKDPRLGMVTITDARVTGDLREATVFYTVYGDETQIADSAKATFNNGVLEIVMPAPSAETRRGRRLDISGGREEGTKT